MSRARDTANFDPSLLADDEVSLDKLGTSGTLDVSSATLTTSTSQKQTIVQAGPGSGTVDVSSGTFTTSTAQKQAIVQAGPGTGTLDVSSGTLTTSTAQKQAIVQAGPGSGTFDVSSGTFTTSADQRRAIVQTGPGTGTLDVSSGTFTTSTAQKQAIVDGATIPGIPAGMILPFGNTTAPTGFLKCEGQAVSRTTYSDLFSAIGTTWGSGDGSSTFNVPDLQGAVLKGTGTAGVSSDYVGPNVGAYQDDQNASHSHNASSSSSGSTGSGGNHRHYDGTAYGGGFFADGAAAGNSNVSNYTDYAGSHTHNVSVSTSTTVASSGGTEARVYNRGVLYCIKT
tara:strand:- start:1269 stop:2285 length:1017 start_codon:yes stop_codon:yes gene_type:complete